jgi:hypothetical protein
MFPIIHQKKVLIYLTSGKLNKRKMERKFNDRMFKALKLYKKFHELWSFILRASRPLKRQLPRLFENNLSPNGLRNNYEQSLSGHL